MGKHAPMTGAERAAKHRAEMRAKGYRLKQFWVLDTRLPEVRAKIAADVAALNAQWETWREEYEFVEAMREEVWDSLPPYEWPDGEEPEIV